MIILLIMSSEHLLCIYIIVSFHFYKKPYEEGMIVPHLT